MIARQVRLDRPRSICRPSTSFAAVRPPVRADQPSARREVGSRPCTSAVADRSSPTAVPSAQKPACTNSRTCGYIADGGFRWRLHGAGWDGCRLGAQVSRAALRRIHAGEVTKTAATGRGQRAMQVRAWVVSLVLAARRGDSQAAAALTGLSRPQASASTTTAAAGRRAEVCPPPVK